MKFFPESSDWSGQVTNNLPFVRTSHENLCGGQSVVIITSSNQKNLQHKVTSDSAHKYNITPPHLLIICIEIISTSMVPSSIVQVGQLSDISLSVVPHHQVPGVVAASHHHTVVSVIFNGAGTTVIIIIVTTSPPHITIYNDIYLLCLIFEIKGLLHSPVISGHL